MRCIRQPQAPGVRPASGLLMVSFAGAGAERRVRRGPGRRVPTASPRREAAAAVAGAAVAARRRPAAAHVRRGAGGELQADEKAWCSSFRGVGVWVTGRCAGFGVTACVLLPRRIVFSGAWTAPSGEDVGRESEAVGRGAPSPTPSARVSPLRGGLRRALRGRADYAAAGSQKPQFAIASVLDIPTSLQVSAENRPETKPRFLPAARRRVKCGGRSIEQVTLSARACLA
jgi:hypothetical protein